MGWALAAGATFGTRAARGGAHGPAHAACTELEAEEIHLGPRSAFGPSFVLFTPTRRRAGERFPVLVLLHGLAETASHALGIYAWLDRYGLGSGYDRLAQPPLSSTRGRIEWTSARLAEVNESLRTRPFGRMVIACPFTPVSRGLDFQAYATWIADTLLPAVHDVAPASARPVDTAIDGCSLGGYNALEVFIRRPDMFGAWGGVQAALSEPTARAIAPRLVAALERSGPRALHIETSTWDVFRPGNELLAHHLQRRGVPHDFRMIPGQHDQPWLREAGTIEMLLWHDRRFASVAR